MDMDGQDCKPPALNSNTSTSTTPPNPLQNQSKNSFTLTPAQQQQFLNVAGLPPNFDLSSLTPIERELLLRRLQQQQMQARQSQSQTNSQPQIPFPQNFGFSVPRPPTLDPQQQQNQQKQFHPFTQQFVNNFSRPHASTGFPSQVQAQGINPAMLQAGSMNSQIIPTELSGHQRQKPRHSQVQANIPMSQINPQQFTNPLAAATATSPIKSSDPLLYSVNSKKNQSSFVSDSQASAVFNIPMLDDQILSSEGNFIDHLIKFLDLIKFTNRIIPQIANRPVSLYRLFQIVNSAGGFLAVGEAKKWPLVTQALQLPAQSFEVVSTIRATYYTFLYAYEQYFIQRKPIDKIDWPNQSKTRQSSQSHQKSTQLPQNQISNSNAISSVPSQSQTPISDIPKSLTFIPDSEIYLWKSFADVMKIPVGPICDLETSILYLNSPYFSLKIEALLATQRLFTQSSPKELQLAGVSLESLKNLIESLESVWTSSVVNLSKRKFSIKTMEDFWTSVDLQKRNVLDSETLSIEKSRDLMICRQIASLLRTLVVTKGNDVCQCIAGSSFIKNTFLPFCLQNADDWELYKESLVLFEAISPFLYFDNENMLKWSLKQCEVELRQVRCERLTSVAFKFTGSLNLERISSFDNLTVARQAVSALITQCAQLWKSVPMHIFLHLSSTLNLLTSANLISHDLKPFALEIEKFMDIFVMPTISLLRSVRALYECTARSSLSFPVTNNNTSTVNSEELKRILETVFYSPAFSLTDGGFLELCLQILAKCQSHQSDSLSRINWTGQIVLLRELREFWRHSACEGITNLGKSCYQINQTGSSPTKKSSNFNFNNNKLPLAILKGSTNITAVFSHPFMLLCRSLELFTNSFSTLSDSAIKLDLLELSIEWNLDTPSKWGREVLGCERLEESLRILREFYF